MERFRDMRGVTFSWEAKESKLTKQQPTKQQKRLSIYQAQRWRVSDDRSFGSTSSIIHLSFPVAR